MPEYKNALIIGAGPGLSASLARQCAKKGMTVSLAARNIEKLADICAETDAAAYACDASNERDVESLFSALDEEGRTPDLLIFNAGYYTRGSLTELDAAEVKKTLVLGAYGAFLAAQNAAKRMLPAGKGGMLFTGASASVKGYANSSPFAMGKFALRGLCQSLARELAPQGIHVAHFVIDGMIRAPERGDAYADPDRTLDPDAIAQTYLAVAEQDCSAWTWEVELRPSTETF